MYTVEITANGLHLIKDVLYLEKMTDWDNQRWAFIKLDTKEELQRYLQDDSLKHIFGVFGWTAYTFEYIQPGFQLADKHDATMFGADSIYRWIEISNSLKGQHAVLHQVLYNEEYLPILSDYE
jgi:hypothetical protein